MSSTGYGASLTTACSPTRTLLSAVPSSSASLATVSPRRSARGRTRWWPSTCRCRAQPCCGPRCHACSRPRGSARRPWHLRCSTSWASLISASGSATTGEPSSSTAQRVGRPTSSPRAFSWWWEPPTPTENAQCSQSLRTLFRIEHDHLRALLDTLSVRHQQLIGELGPTQAVVTHRLEVAKMAQQAVDVELRVAGGRGYRASSPTARRVREAAFLPIQSPTEGHLRFELDSFVPGEVPAPAVGGDR